MQSLTGLAHTLICQRVALPSFSVLAHGAAWLSARTSRGFRPYSRPGAAAN
jgi:hypothetical protein